MKPFPAMRALQYWFLAYGVTTLVAIGLSFVMGKAFYLPLSQLSRFRMTEGNSFTISFLFPILIQIPFYFYFSTRFLRSLGRLSEPQLKKSVLRLTVMWTIGAIVADLFFWIVVPSRIQMEAGALFGDYTPFLVLIYLAIFSMTWLGSLPVSRKFGS